jgi:hypothetical protein
MRGGSLIAKAASVEMIGDWPTIGWRGNEPAQDDDNGDGQDDTDDYREKEVDQDRHSVLKLAQGLWMRFGGCKDSNMELAEFAKN